MQFYANRGDVDNCSAMMAAIVKNKKADLDARAHATVLNAAAKAVMNMASLPERRLMGFRADAILASILLQFYSGKDADKGDIEYLIGKMHHVWCTTLSHKEAEDRVKVFSQHGISPPSMAYGNLLGMYERMTDGDSAKAIVDHMLAQGLTPTGGMLCKVALCYCRAGETELAVEAVKRAVDAGHDVSM